MNPSFPAPCCTLWTRQVCPAELVNPLLIQAGLCTAQWPAALSLYIETQQLYKNSRTSFPVLDAVNEQHISSVFALSLFAPPLLMEAELNQFLCIYQLHEFKLTSLSPLSLSVKTEQNKHFLQHSDRKCVDLCSVILHYFLNCRPFLGGGNLCMKKMKQKENRVGTKMHITAKVTDWIYSRFSVLTGDSKYRS